MSNRVLTVSLFLSALTLSTLAQKNSSPMRPAGPVPDRALVEKIWAGWATLDPANVAQYYAPGPHTFFDIAPVKYGSWDEYQAGVKNVLAAYKSARFTVNDDLAVHPHPDVVWATSTIKQEMTTAAGKVDMGVFRWTVVWENQDGKWLIVHEHVSAPIQ